MPIPPTTQSGTISQVKEEGSSPLSPSAPMPASDSYTAGLDSLRSKDYQKALSYFQEAADENPRPEAYFQIGYCKEHLGRNKEAIEVYAKAIRIWPDNIEAKNRLGAAYISIGRYSEALQPLLAAIRMNPKDIDAHYNLGLAYAKLGYRKSALYEYETPRQLNPDLASDLYRLFAETGLFDREG